MYLGYLLIVRQSKTDVQRSKVQKTGDIRQVKTQFSTIKLLKNCSAADLCLENIVLKFTT